MTLLTSTHWDAIYLEVGDRAIGHLVAENDINRNPYHVTYLARVAEWRAADRKARA